MQEDGHVWHERVFASMRLKCCMNCGFIKNEDKPNKACPGFVSVSTRTESKNEVGKRVFGIKAS